jgi:import inner membrane translocase subunit TIM23
MSWLFGGKKEEPVKEQTFNLDPREAAPEVQSFLPSVDVAKLHPLAGLNQGTLEYLNLEDETPTSTPGTGSIIPIKDWTDDLCYGTGAVYLTGLGMGGLYGLREGLRKTSNTQSPRLRLNGVLNAVTRRGPFLGNSAGVLALTYNLINSSIDYFRGGEHDWMGSIAAGALSGAIFKATKGPKPMAIASGLMATAAGTWCLLKRSLLG